MNFGKLAFRIQQTNTILQQNAVKAVNTHLTLRNWLIGYYIVEFEQNGSDRAEYGNKLITEISKAVQIKGLSETNLKLCRQFYIIYPQILSLLFQQEFKNILPADFIKDVIAENKSNSIGQSLTDELESTDSQLVKIGQSLTDEFGNSYLQQLITSISFTHFTEIIKIDEPIKRRFYELLVLKTQPSVRELKRQIDSLTYERVGLSENQDASFQEVMKKIQPQQTTDLIKSHYFFEFLNIKQSHLIEENDLEQGLIQHLQQFIIELGNGFCFEARQKRLLIGNEYYFIDLVFYHRILKCHILVELKTETAKHEHIGQLKSYLNYYKKNVQESSDNPPVGILLVTNQNKALVEYAIADSDLDLFVSKYQLQLPDKSKLEAFINNELKNI